jgi:hypothetical protein
MDVGFAKAVIVDLIAAEKEVSTNKLLRRYRTFYRRSEDRAMVEALETNDLAFYQMLEELQGEGKIQVRMAPRSCRMYRVVDDA